MNLLNENPTFNQYFQHVGCLQFCEKLQGFHTQIDKDFILNYDGVRTKVSPLDINVSVDSIAQAIDIPRYA